MSSKSSSIPTISDKAKGQYQYSMDAQKDRLQTQWLLKQIAWKGKPPEMFGYCVKDSVFVACDTMNGPVYRDYQNQTHQEPICHIVKADIGEMLKMSPKVGEIMNAIGKASMAVSEAVLENAKQENADRLREGYIKSLRESKKKINITEDSPYLDEN